MEWMPDLKIGVWNAWILTFHPLLFPFLMVALDKAGMGGMRKKMGEVPYKKGELRAFMTSMVVMLILIAYSVFLPLHLGTIWFYIGIVTYLVGLVPYLIAVVNIATTPLGQPWTSGIYRYSRHPMTFSTFLAWAGQHCFWFLDSLAAIGSIHSSAES